MRNNSNGAVLGVNDLAPFAQSYLAMPKDVVDGRLDYDWPLAGSQLRIELQSNEDRRIRFFLDIYEGRRESMAVARSQQGMEGAFAPGVRKAK